jgi:hypothetical protein
LFFFKIFFCSCLRVEIKNSLINGHGVFIRVKYVVQLALNISNCYFHSILTTGGSKGLIYVTQSIPTYLMVINSTTSLPNAVTHTEQTSFTYLITNSLFKNDTSVGGSLLSTSAFSLHYVSISYTNTSFFHCMAYNYSTFFDTALSFSEQVKPVSQKTKKLDNSDDHLVTTFMCSSYIIFISLSNITSTSSRVIMQDLSFQCCFNEKVVATTTDAIKSFSNGDFNFHQVKKKIMHSNRNEFNSSTSKENTESTSPSQSSPIISVPVPPIQLYEYVDEDFHDLLSIYDWDNDRIAMNRYKMIANLDCDREIRQDCPDIDYENLIYEDQNSVLDDISENTNFTVVADMSITFISFIRPTPIKIIINRCTFNNNFITSPSLAGSELQYTYSCGNSGGSGSTTSPSEPTFFDLIMHTHALNLEGRNCSYIVGPTSENLDSFKSRRFCYENFSAQFPSSSINITEVTFRRCSSSISSTYEKKHLVHENEASGSCIFIPVNFYKEGSVILLNNIRGLLYIIPCIFFFNR